MGVIMQAFYWNCPKLEDQEYRWWNYVTGKIPKLCQAGFAALWLPPANKAANIGGASMGYDPYDYYDLGDLNQKGSTPTWFGTRRELEDLIQAAHHHRMQVYADLVLNHCSGGDEIETNPLDHKQRWTKFTPRSGKFCRDYKCFHPSPYETWDDGTFGDMPDLCHRNPYVYTEMIEYARWLLEEMSFDGFRYDCVKGYGGWVVRAIQELRALRDDSPFKPFGVGECWDSDRAIDDWLEETNAWSDNPAGAFDFPLRDRLKALCDFPGFSLTTLGEGGTLQKDYPSAAITFVENHDLARDNPIIHDKMLAYAFILAHEGYPCIFWQDYYSWNLGLEGNAQGIAALVRIHEDHAGGTRAILYADHDLYVMERKGWKDQRGLIFVMNNRGDGWNGKRVQTQWRGKKFTPGAWWGHDGGTPQEKWTDPEGYGEFWAPPRGYVVYVPE